MDVRSAIHKHYNKDIKSITPLTGGFSFETLLITFHDNDKVVFRSANDFVTSGGRKIVISETFHREKFFYDSVNAEISHICPNVYVIDDSLEVYNKPFQISEFLEGIPLNLYYNNLDESERYRIDYKVGETCAQINALQINPSHPYVTKRGGWETFLANRIVERLAPFRNDLISQDEIDKITGCIVSQKPANTLSFLHLDMRYVNMIYQNGKILVLDAENSEFGDPLFDVATVDFSGGLNEAFLKGYENILGASLDLNQYLYYCYKFERASLVLDLFMNEIKSDTQATALYFEQFHQIKDKLLQ